MASLRSLATASSKVNGLLDMQGSIATCLTPKLRPAITYGQPEALLSAEAAHLGAPMSVICLPHPTQATEGQDLRLRGGAGLT